nr:DNA-directed RNA polymerases IV and V subunit 2-like [Coffea arabica]
MDVPDARKDPGIGSSKDKLSDETLLMDIDDIDFDDFDDMLNSVTLQELGEDFLKKFCKKAATAFFEQYGLISHQINSYNNFVKYGIQQMFDSVGEIVVEPGFDPSKRGDGEWKYASIKFGKVILDKPDFWTGDKFFGDGGKEYLKFLPCHARLQSMTYSARIKVETHVQVYTKKLLASDKAKTGRAVHIENECEKEEKREVIIGRLPVMVRSDLCWMNGVEKDDCEFDHGGYFIIKGAEKTFVAQEQICLTRLWLSCVPCWTVSYRPVARRKRVYLKLVDESKFANLIGGQRVLSVYFVIAEMPVWILFFALGASSDREVVDLIDLNIEDTKIANILTGSIYYADTKFEDADLKCKGGFRKGRNALDYVQMLLNNCKYPPAESVEECISNLLFPNLTGFKQKACFLGYMVKCLLEAYTGRRKVDNRDDFRNKRLELASELLERELKVHLKHVERCMVKAMQRDLYGDRSLQSIEHYLDASIISNGLSRAFSTGAWSHPYKKERVSGVVASLRRTNPLQMTADMRKTRQQVSYIGKVGDARYPHCSHWGKICFLSTPDGENCGLVKNLASLGLVSTKVLEPLIERLLNCGLKQLVDHASSLVHGEHKIFLDGDWIGTCKDSAFFVAELRSKRRNKEIPPQVEIKRDEHHGEIRIFSDAGRVLRPLLVVENLKKIKDLKGENYSFQSLLDKGIIELIGPEEEEDCPTAWAIDYLYTGNRENPSMKYTHCELDMSFLLGLSCGIIPYANHDHARRVLYQSEKHSQQAIGFSTTNPSIRVDTNIHQLYYPCFSTAKNEYGFQVRSPSLGDKFSSMHGQKGVLGFLESQENFPFTAQGIVPDIVINPHAFPSRQTPGQLLEAALAKGIALGGVQKYATPFSALSVDAVTDQLHRLGFSRWGNERVYSGRTGEMIHSMVFMGPTFYQRLIHMAEDKVKFRNTGPVHPLTRQPVADRKRFGGIKFGEMERDCLIAHGAASNLHERLFTLSDSSEMHICRKCKSMANVIQRSVFGGRKIRGPFCRFCESAEDIVKVNVPYGAKLLSQELFSMGISLKFDAELC